jgi:hypothetical protein
LSCLVLSCLHSPFALMAASPSAILTLLALVFAGPLFYLGRHIFRLLRPPPPPTPSLGRTNSDEVHTNDNGKEVVSSSSYLLGLVGYAVGIGNVWRFPYLVGQYGGGAFVFAYAVCLFMIAMPLYFVELGLGQHTRLGSIATLNSKWGVASYSHFTQLQCPLLYNALFALFTTLFYTELHCNVHHYLHCTILYHTILYVLWCIYVIIIYMVSCLYSD